MGSERKYAVWHHARLGSLVFENVIEPNVQVDWTVSGTALSTTANVDLYFTSPDA